MSRGPRSETMAVSVPDQEPRPRPASLPFMRAAARGGVGGVPCVTLGDVPVALDSLAWRMGAALRCTFIMKADFPLDVASGPGPLAPRPASMPPRFCPADVHFRNQPMAHVIAASDRVPWKASIDVTVLGHARAAFGRPVPEVALRVAVLEGSEVLLQKRARALGNRATPESAPEPFVTMPVTHERAYGGPATLTNPIGTGDDADDPPPNIIDPDNAWRPAAFGPLAAGWPLRHRKLGAFKRRDLDEPIMTLPLGFDVSYFQSAPADQQLAALGPAARLVLEGFHAERPALEMALPAALPAGALYGLSAEAPEAPLPLAFRMDTLHLDADAWVCTLVFRACVDLPDEAALGRLLVAAGLGMDGQAPALPDRRPRPEDATVPRGARAVPAHRPTGTLDIHSSSQVGVASLPFGRTPVPEQDATQALAAPAAGPPGPPPAAVRPPAPPPAAAPELPSPPVTVAAPTVVNEVRVEAAPSMATPSPGAAASTPASAPAPAAPAKDPYGQVTPWARGPDDAGAGAAEAAAAKPRARPERKFTLGKGFGKR